jgi:hypothetical protein
MGGFNGEATLLAQVGGTALGLGGGLGLGGVDSLWGPVVCGPLGLTIGMS